MEFRETFGFPTALFWESSPVGLLELLTHSAPESLALESWRASLGGGDEREGGLLDGWMGTTAAKKATLNMTRGDIDDGDLMALSEDARYRNEVLDDDYDFM